MKIEFEEFHEGEVTIECGQLAAPVISGRLLLLLERYQERTGVSVPVLFRSFWVTGLAVNTFKMENPDSPFDCHNVCFMAYCEAIRAAVRGGSLI